MKRIVPFIAHTLASAVLGIALVGCESESFSNGGGVDKNAEVQRQAVLASHQDQAPVAFTGEATDSDVIAISQPSTETMNWLKVSSSGFTPNGAIPDKFVAGGKDSPVLEWSQIPAETRSFALIVEDPDATSPRPFIHLIAYNIPSDLGKLDLGALQSSRYASRGLLLGKNSKGSMNYIAPQPPSGESAHHYHYQIFALDTELGLPDGASKKDLMDAMNGHVLAKGEIVGMHQAK